MLIYCWNHQQEIYKTWLFPNGIYLYHVTSINLIELYCFLEYSLKNFALKYQLSFCWLFLLCQQVAISNSQAPERFPFSCLSFSWLNKEIEFFVCTESCMNTREQFKMYPEMKWKCSLSWFLIQHPLFTEDYAFRVFEWQKSDLFLLWAFQFAFIYIVWLTCFTH